MKSWRDPAPNEWEIKMFYDRFPNGCSQGCHCVHPADDCGCDDCERRHAYAAVRSRSIGIRFIIRFN